ncbi:MAG TPA: hypothetical protein VGO63_02260 [Candidatus Paceibacterota bacterium]|nr:hypothetical protein [Candidatus Paceibacterota bacterium]
MTILSLVLVMFGGLQPQTATAAGLTGISDVMSREKAATKSTHKITFVSTTAMVASGTITINFSTFTGTPVLADVQICHGVATGLENGTAAVTGTSCTATSETLAASNGASTIWGGVWTGTSLVLTAPSGTPTFNINAGHKVTVFVTATNITNPAVSSPVVTIAGSNGDSGNFAAAIIDDDQVSVTATVNSSITFDIDTATTNTNSVTPYSVALGAITTAAVKGSDHSTINSIWVDLDTNATGGATISVASANAALKSVAIPADTIPSATATMANGIANYGVCANSVSGLTDVSPFNGATCTTTPTGNTVGVLTVAPQNIFSVAAPVASGRGEIFVDAENSTATVAHPDYADTLTLIATGNF